MATLRVVTRRVKTKIMSKKETLILVLAVGAIVVSIIALASNGLFATKQSSEESLNDNVEVFEEKPASSPFDLTN